MGMSKEICELCGAEQFPEALYCHDCGTQIIIESITEPEPSLKPKGELSISQTAPPLSLLSIIRKPIRFKQVALIGIIISILFFTGVIPPNNDFIITVMGYNVKDDNSVDADSDIDSVANIGDDDTTDYTDAQALDGSDQTIAESNEVGGGGSSLRAKILENGLINDRRYFPEYQDGEMILGNENTFGVSTYKTWLGQYKPISDWSPSIVNTTNNRTGVDLEEYTANGGSFKSIFRDTNNTLYGDGWEFTQRPNRIFLYNWETEARQPLVTAQPPDDFIYNSGNNRIRYTNPFPNTFLYFGYDGTTFKEVLRSTTIPSNYPSDPWSQDVTYIVLDTIILDHKGFGLADDTGRIVKNTTIVGRLKLLDAYDDVKAYLPAGTAWAYFNALGDNVTIDVKTRLRVIDDVWHLYTAFNYTLCIHPARTGDVYLDPSWVIGDENSWGDTEFYQTMENTTTNYAQLYPSNSTGNITSSVNQAMKNWIKIKWEGDNNSKTVDIYWNSSRDNGLIDPFEIQVVQTSSSPNTWYNFPVEEKYGSWRLVLTTDNPSITPEIYNVTVQNDPPDATDFSYYKEIEINSGEVDGSGSHSDFAFLLNITDSDLADNCQADFDDIAFSNDSAWLDHEIEDYNSGTGLLLAWIRIPSLSTSSNTTIYMYYGNDTMGAQENPTGVWDSDYVAVWHLPEDPSGSSPQMYDSTANDNDGISGGSMTSGDQVDGQIDGSLDFDGSNDVIKAEDSTSIDSMTDAITISAWINKGAYATGHRYGKIVNRPLSSVTNPWNVWSLNMDDTLGDNPNIQFQISTGSPSPVNLESTSTVTTGAWIYVVATYDGSTMRIYFNSVDEAQTSTSITLGTTDVDLQIGNWDLSSDNRFFGILDEIRISNVSRDAYWIATEYNNQYDYDSFFDIGTEIAVTPPTDNEEDYVSAITDNHPPDDIGTYDDWTNMQLYDSTDTLLNETSDSESAEAINWHEGFENVLGTEAEDSENWWTEYWWHGSTSDQTNVNWTLTNTDTDSGSTGADAPYAGTWYAYTEVSGSYNEDWWLTTQSSINFNVLLNEQIEFAYHMYGNDFNDAGSYVELEYNGTGSWVDVWQWDSEETEAWFTNVTDLSGLTGEGHLRFFVNAGNSYQNDFCLDQINITADGMAGEANYVFDREFSFTSLPLPAEYSYSTAELCIATGVISAENLMVDVWNATSSSWVWIMNITDSDDNTWLNTSVFAYFNLSVTYLHFRFNDSLNLAYTGSNDTVNNEWYIDALLIHYWNITAPYRLEWEHQVQSVDTQKDSYNVTIYGFSSSATENFTIQLWNTTSSDWINTTYYINTTETWYNYTIDSYAGVVSENITWRYLDLLTTVDESQTTLSIDYAGISYWNFTIDLIPTTLNWSVIQNDTLWHLIPTNPVYINISSGISYDVEVRGTDGAFSPIANNLVRFNTVNNSATGTNLTTSYQTLFNDQSAGETQLSFYIWVTGGLGGIGPYTFTLYVRITKA